MTSWPDERIMATLQARNPVDDSRFDGSAFTDEGRSLLESLLVMPVDDVRPPHHRFPVRLRVLAPVVAGVAAVVVATALVVDGLAPGISPREPSAAAAVLEQAGRAAARAASSPTLGPGQWIYTESIGTRRVGNDSHPNDPIDLVYPHVTTQGWVAADGARRQMVTYGGPPTFATSTSRQNWEAIGSPSTVLATPANYVTTDSLVPLLNVAALPTDPAALLQAVENGTTAAADVKTEGSATHGTPFKTFVNCLALLTRPVIGATPTFRSSVLNAMAEIPGVQLLGQGTDALGRTGKTIGGAQAPTGLRQEFILDPTTGEVLASMQVVTALTHQAVARGYSLGLVVAQTTYVASGIATSNASIPASTPGKQQTAG